MNKSSRLLANAFDQVSAFGRRESFQILFLYVFMIGGGLWHVLDQFTGLMQVMSGPVIIVLAFALVWAQHDELRKLNDKRIVSRFYSWSLLVFVSSFLIEMAGVRSGLIFGEYHYGTTLQPMLLDVPVAIGFAWLSMLLSSIAVLQRSGIAQPTQKPWRSIILTALLMVVFDFVMEPAAVKLRYWTWQDGIIPLQNYIAWFLVSLFLMYIAIKRGLFRTRLPRLAFHAFFAQLAYFILVYWRN